MLFDTTVSALQTGLSVNGEAGGDGSISGTLRFLDSGPIAEYWGAGYFMALKFQPGDEDVTVSVGLDPSEGSGLVPLDADLNGVFKVTDPESQTFIVETVKDGETLRQTFNLAGVTLEPAPQPAGFTVSPNPLTVTVGESVTLHGFVDGVEIDSGDLAFDGAFDIADETAADHGDLDEPTVIHGKKVGATSVTVTYLEYPAVTVPITVTAS